MDPRLKRTQFAAHAATLAEEFEAALRDYTVGAFRLDMTAPEGTTGGGVQALQHIRLVPAEDAPPGARIYVVGNANRSTRLSELRSLEYVDQTSIQRFGQPTRLDAAQYRACMTAAARFLTTWGISVVQVGAPPEPAAPPRARGRSRLVVILVVVWTLAVLAIGLVVGILASQGRLSR
jgi:hypothetical protein